MEPVQAAEVLGQRSPPRHGHREEQHVEADIVESLSDIAAGHDQYPLLAVGYVFQALHDLAALSLPCRL